MTASAAGRRMLLVGGGGGLVGRALLREFGSDWSIRSVHRHPSSEEQKVGVEWIPRDVADVRDWGPLLRDVDLVVNVAWLRTGSMSRFRPLTEGLLRLVRACEDAPIDRLVHLSVPDAPASLEQDLPYLSCKRVIDRSVELGSFPFLILRPTMLFAPRDVLLTVMLRVMNRYHTFPMFGDGEYHMSPISTEDLAAILRHELTRPGSRSVLLGGPRRYRYIELTDEMWAALGRPPRYWSISTRNSVRLARLMETLGSHLLYAYEVTWLLSDMLGLPPYTGLDRPLIPVEPFLKEEAERLRTPRKGR